jgi:AraC family transcriptional regulator of adaptative response / DNA-3-methyladenine glycosylase II
MKEDVKACYTAFVSRDARFDGVFFIGVTSTGIYCRPICPARTPKQSNCRFFGSAEAAEKASFRPCLRCRPELAPGYAPVDDAQRIARLIVHRMAEGLAEDSTGLEAIASQFELSSRQIRRILQKELGVSPIELIQTRRLLLAKQLLTETRLPVTEIAFASGFSSLRRFNDVFKKYYRMPPSHLRKEASEYEDKIDAADTSVVQLAYRPPYDWRGILAFLSARMMKGAEWVTGEAYYRTVRLGRCRGWIAVRHAPEKHALQVEFTHSLAPVLPALLERLRHLFDLGARPDLIAAQLMRDRFLKKSVARNPGLRVPGAFDGFEMAVRAVLGQQITVKAATTLAGRFAGAFGEKIVTPFAELNRLSPPAERIAELGAGQIAELGIIRTRAESIIRLAQAVLAGRVQLEAGAHPDRAIAQLVALPGLGQWTAHYIAMRALRWPDAFPKEDIAIRKNLGGVTAKQAEDMSQGWRPWRSYAVLHIWQNPVTKPRRGKA